jgi:hypothetical protein
MHWSFFFGVPNQGLDNSNMKALLGSQRNAHLVEDLRTGAALLEEIHSKFRHTFATIKHCWVISFYEGRESNTIEVRIHAGIFAGIL